MYELLENEGIAADMVTYVPVHKNRKRERGL
jgi:predicted amidophosphoribosyltransferase